MMAIKSNLRRVLSFHGSSTFSCLNQFTSEFNLSLSSVIRRNFSFDNSSSSSIELKHPKHNLYPRLLRIRNAQGSVLPVLNKWVDEGNTVDQNDVRRIIKQLRKSRRFKHCLEISEWMAGIEYLDFSPGDAAVRLDLLSKVCGLIQGEKYFDSIPEDSRSVHVYNALLNCYTRAMLLDKAEATMQKMKELGYLEPLAYSNMLKLYCKMGKQENISTLTQEMKDKGISFEELSYSVQLHTYSAVLDIARLEKLLLKMEADSLFSMDWDKYALAANVYLKAGAAEKAKRAVEKSEQLIDGRITTNAYEALMTIYAKMGSKNDVLRLWNVRKNAGKLHYSSYSSVITSLIKLNDLESAEKLLEEWQADKINNITFDMRVANCLVNAYCGTCYMEKAESLVGKLIESRHFPCASIWKPIILGYRKCKRMDKAINTVRKAIGCGWKPDLATVGDCVEYLEGKGDVDGAKQFAEMLKAQNKLSMKVRNRLEKYGKDKNM